MTKKRYFNIIPSGIQDVKTGKIIRGSKIGDLLNEQEEQIRELKKENEQFKKAFIELHQNFTTLTKVKYINKCGDIND